MAALGAIKTNQIHHIGDEKKKIVLFFLKNFYIPEFMVLFEQLAKLENFNPLKNFFLSRANI